MATAVEERNPHLRDGVRHCASTCTPTHASGARSPGPRIPGDAPARGGRVSTLLSLAALSGRYSPRIDEPQLHLPAPLRSPGVTRLHRYYGCSDSCTAALRTGLTAHEHRSVSRAGLPALRVWPSEHSAPNHLARPRHRFNTQPLSVTGFLKPECPDFESRLRPFPSRLAARPGRNGFVILRTARSPPVALHLASRRRSYVQLQAGVCMPEEDSHLSDQTRLQAHWGAYRDLARRSGDPSLRLAAPSRLLRSARPRLSQRGTPRHGAG
jgi:hypothetical protein